MLRDEWYSDGWEISPLCLPTCNPKQWALFLDFIRIDVFSVLFLKDLI